MCVLFFFDDTPATQFYTYVHPLSLHCSLPICHPGSLPAGRAPPTAGLKRLCAGSVASVAFRREATRIQVRFKVLQPGRFLPADIRRDFHATTLGRHFDVVRAHAVPVAAPHDGPIRFMELEVTAALIRSVERRVRHAGVSTFSSRWL